jgi:vitamin B12/bleomycin/antimicrobial peptide transport system ATP-binding/permease protein
MIDTARRQIVREAWRLAKPYWTSEEKWSAWGLLLAVIALNLGNVYISVRINAWNNAFYNALQAFNSGELFRQLGALCILVQRYIDFLVVRMRLSVWA